MAVERRLTEIVGPLGGKLHTGRSRNDQVATDLALYVSRARRARGRADRGADGDARRRRRGPRRLADARIHAPPARSARLPRRITSSPTSGCSAATPAVRRGARGRAGGVAARLGGPGGQREVDREATAARPGLRRPSPNSIDAVSSRDFALDYLSAASICATHLSRLGAELVLWSSQEFGFCEPADDFSSGSA